MAELYIRNWEDETTATNYPKTAHRKGDVLFVKPDGHSDNPNWQFSQEANTDKVVMIKCPEISFSEAVARSRPWRDDFGYTVLASNAGQGTYDIRIFEKTPGASGEHNITRTKIESFLSRWNCENLVFGTDGENYAEFRLPLWGAVRSVGFWDAPVVVDTTDFTLLQYSGSTGIGEFRAWVSDTPLVDEGSIVPWIMRRGGEVLTAQHPVYTFRMERTVLLQAFKDDVKRVVERTYRAHRYYVTQSVIDWILAQDNGPTVTLAQLETYLQDKAA